MRLRQSDAQSAQARHETITFQGVIRVSSFGLYLFGSAAARGARVARHRRQAEPQGHTRRDVRLRREAEGLSPSRMRERDCGDTWVMGLLHTRMAHALNCHFPYRYFFLRLFHTHTTGVGGV